MMEAVIDVMQWLVIIYLMVVLFFITRKLGRLQRSWEAPVRYMLPRTPEEPKAVCGCDHHQCFHDENGCGSSWCGCKRYMGPEHLPEVIP